MAGRTPAQAVQAFIDPLSRAASCVTRAVINISPGGYAPRGGPHAASLGHGQAVPLKDCDLAISAGLQYDVVWTDDEDRGPWKVTTRAYVYALRQRDESEILAFHWQPGVSGPPWPHLHVGTCVLQPDHLLDRKKHIPTGRIALEDVIALAIEMGAVALRDDYQQVLEETRQLFLRWRTWAHWPALEPRDPR